MSNVITYLQENLEKLKLIGYFAVILALAWPIAQMLGSAWEASNIVRSLFDVLIMYGVSLEASSVTIFGFFLGLLALMTIDPKKRWQAFLLWFGLLLGLVGLQTMDLFLPNVDLVGSAGWLLFGLVSGVVVGGGRKLFRMQTAQALEFRRASKLIFYMVASFCVVAFLELHINYPALIDVADNSVAMQSVSLSATEINASNIELHAAATVLFVVTMKQFVKYDAETDFFILGPRASGKSLFLIGAYLEALDRTDSVKSNTPLNPSQDLMSMVEALDRQETKWIVEATGRGEVKDLRFQYVHGSVFPKNVKLSGIDYAGEYLQRLPDALTGMIAEEDMDMTLRRLAEGVRGADTLLLVIDIERFVNNEQMEISSYFSILQSAKNKDVMIVATKADYLAEDFRTERGLEPHRYFEDFKQYVNNRLRESENVNSLITETAGAEVHPVYYQTTIDENGNRVPMRDETGSVTTVGFTELLNKFGRG